MVRMPKQRIVTSLSDSLLLQQFYEDGDESSFEELFMRHYDMVYGVLYRLMGTRQAAEDVAQEVFLHLSQRKLTHEENIAGWLYRVAVNRGYNHLKAENRRWKREQASLAEPREVGNEPPESVVLQQQAQQRVRRVLASLKPRDAKILVLRESGFQYREIAGIVGVAPSSIGKLLTRALAAFELTYRNMYPDDQLDV